MNPDISQERDLSLDFDNKIYHTVNSNKTSDSNLEK